MRTTLTIEPAVANQIRKRMEIKRASLKAVINEALREGLRSIGEKPEGRAPSFQVEPHAFGFRAGIDLDKIGQFADEFEDEERLKALQTKVR